MREYFVAVYSPGPNWDEGKGAREKRPNVHIEYQHEQFHAGKLVMGGPFLDRECGMALFRAADMAEAQAIVAADPLVSRGVYAVELYHWRAAVSAFED